MKNRLVVPIFILCIALILPSCTSFPLLPSPTPKCIGDTWSYEENVQTKIEINPDLKIRIIRFAPDVVHRTSSSSYVTIYGDGRVFYTSENTVEKQISKEQLQQIVTAFEEGNFFAITAGCGGEVVRALDASTLDISVKTDGKFHEIKDGGACHVYHFDNYCNLGDKIDVVLGTPW